MHENIIYLSSGLFLGLIAGIFPGPLLTLVVSETFKYGQKEGIKLALAPLITDLPIVLASCFLIASLANNDIILGIIAICGGVFLLFLAYENIRYKSSEAGLESKNTRTLQKGIIANFLNPHPYIFWILIGAPTIAKANEISLLTAVLFLLGFYFMLIGSKTVLALLTGKMKNILQQKTFVIIIRVLGVTLLLFAIVLFREAVNYIL
ncbi:hypothetical protein ES705_38563 [subsurface metagenome]